jgi:hydrogenase maturation protein HypF
MKRQRISITGRVQGVGFRPAVYKIATALGLSGFVYNHTNGVTIELQGSEQKISEFLRRLKSEKEKPPMAEIKTCDVINIPPVQGDNKFFIQISDSQGTPLSQVTADISTCKDCLNEMADKTDFRYGYPFINCTNCGPRYSIIKNIPYDRSNTTMSVFEMCEKCAAQYVDVTDRRFHAQPVACPSCGPKIWLTDSNGKILQEQTEKVVTETARLLLEGKILAIKGLGGFHLAVNALDNQAVKRLRERKKRDCKPFAMMTDSIEKIKEYAIVDSLAEQILKSPESPIVLLPEKKNNTIAPAVAEGVNTFGFMLCYTPLHFLLFGQGIDVLVMTSGNISDEPLICKNGPALEKLGGVADAFLMHDREIFRQVDDSVVYFIENKPVLLRRSRGYVPTPIYIRRASCVMRDALENEGSNTQQAISNTHYEKDIFAAGADLKNTFCFAKQNQLICSEHIGDLEDAEVYHHYVDSIRHLAKLFEVKPEVVAYDLHPGYFSTRYAQSLNGQRLIQIQHHWAHVASVLAENGIDGPVIGLVCDGTGYGTDGTIWGCECLIASLEKFERFGHLEYYRLAGADKASKEAIRPLLSLLKKAYGEKFSLQKFDWLLERIEPDMNKVRIISEQLDKNVNCVQTSSLGRIFDAAAALLELGGYNHFDAQLPMALEAVAATDVKDCYEYAMSFSPGQPCNLDLGLAIKGIVADVRDGIDSGIISAKFHNTIAAALLGLAKIARESTKLETVALSGGVFCNRYLISHLIRLLKKSGFDVLFNRQVPSNDGGISLGQAAIATKLTSL